jgi:hypothetical protein
MSAGSTASGMSAASWIASRRLPGRIDACGQLPVRNSRGSFRLSDDYMVPDGRGGREAKCEERATLGTKQPILMGEARNHDAHHADHLAPWRSEMRPGHHSPE